MLTKHHITRTKEAIVVANIFDVADFFVYLANQLEDDQISNLKLNKLLYYAQGTHLARTGKPLFENAIEAWQYGPVVPEVYQKYKACGKNPIPSPDGDIDRSKYSPEELETLLVPLEQAVEMVNFLLVKLSHTQVNMCSFG